MAKKIVSLETESVTFETGMGSHTIELSELSPEMLKQCALHGISQKVGDSYANAKTATDDTEMTVEEYVEQCVVAGIQQLRDGDWTIRTGTAGPRVTDLARAIAEATGESEETVAEKLADADSDTKKALRADPAVAPILARIRAERAAKKAKEAESQTGESQLANLLG